MPEARILVIEDNPFMSQLLASRLKANDYEVITALGGLEGLNKAQKDQPDLILLDINMPSMNGFEAAAKLKAMVETKSTPVIFVTAKGEDKDIFKAITELGSASYIIKPFKPETLLEEIKKALNKKRNEQVG